MTLLEILKANRRYKFTKKDFSTISYCGKECKHTSKVFICDCIEYSKYSIKANYYQVVILK